jgi:hypothetical protein
MTVPCSAVTAGARLVDLRRHCWLLTLAALMRPQSTLNPLGSAE